MVRRTPPVRQVLRHLVIIVVLAGFDVLCLVSGKAPIGAGIFSAALALYVIWLVQ